MRQIGSIPNEDLARRFAAYLLTMGIRSQSDANSDGSFAVWIHEEDHIATGRTEITAFLEKPDESKYVEAEAAASHLIRQEPRKTGKPSKQVNSKRRSNRNWIEACPATFILMVLSFGTVAVTTDWDQGFYEFANLEEPALHWMRIAEEGDTSLSRVESGEVWRVITPIFIHMNIMHLLFNMLMMRDLGSYVEFHLGTPRYALLAVVLAIASNLGQYFWVDQFFGGMSGVLYGLFGYAWVKGRLEPWGSIRVPPKVVLWLMAWYIACLTGALGPIANASHSFGLVGGMSIAFVFALVAKMKPQD